MRCVVGGRSRTKPFARHIAHITVVIELHPGPAVPLVEDGHGLAMQRLGIESRSRKRGSRRNGTAEAADLPGIALHVALGIDHATQMLGRKIFAERVPARIELRHAFELSTEELEQRAGSLRLAALRPARLLARHPAVDVEMGESLGILHEALEEQRRRYRAGKRRLRRCD